MASRAMHCTSSSQDPLVGGLLHTWWTCDENSRGRIEDGKKRSNPSNVHLLAAKEYVYCLWNQAPVPSKLPTGAAARIPFISSVSASQLTELTEEFGGVPIMRIRAYWSPYLGSLCSWKLPVSSGC